MKNVVSTSPLRLFQTKKYRLVNIIIGTLATVAAICVVELASLGQSGLKEFVSFPYVVTFFETNETETDETDDDVTVCTETCHGSFDHNFDRCVF